MTLLVLILFFSSLLHAFSSDKPTSFQSINTPAPSSSDLIEINEYLISLSTELSPEEREKLFSRLGVKEVSRVTRSTPLFLVTAPTSIQLSDIQKKSKKEKSVRYIESNIRYSVPKPVTPEQ